MTNEIEHFPTPLLALSEDYEKINSIVATLNTEHEAAARADLAESLSTLCALSEDAKEQALYPFLEDAGESNPALLMTKSTEQLRAAIGPVYEAVHHSVPMDAHLADPEGFERNISTLVATLERHLELEQKVLFPVLDGLPPSSQEDLSERLQVARGHSLEHPYPPRNVILRWLRRAEERIDHLHDTSQQYRPGDEHLEANGVAPPPK